jgi:hypothetical protein
MSWETIGQLALVIAVIAAQWPALRRQWLEDRAGAIKTVRLLLYYFVYLGVGLFVLFGAIGQGGASEAEALAATAFILGWVLLGASWLVKVVPRYREVPAWILKPFGILDAISLAVIAASLVVLLG